MARGEEVVEAGLTNDNTSINRNPDDEDDEIQLSGCGATICCDPRRSVHRFFVLIFMCFLSFGSYFCYDNPGALEKQITDTMGVTTSQYMALYSLYSWPNVILCFFGGFLIDRVFGIRLGAIIFSSIIFVGQIVFALGAIVDLYWLMEVGRFIFGVGGESLAVAQNTYAVSWFIGKELNMVFGLQLSFSRVGSTVNFVSMQPIYNAIGRTYTGYMCLGISLMIAAVTCLFSLICALILAFFDRRAEKILNKKQSETGEVVQLKDTKDFPLSFWMICIICVAYYVAIFPFTSLGVLFFERKFDLPPGSASAVNSLVYLISAVASPFFGFALDKVGYNVLFVFIAVLCTIGSHALMAFTFLTPFVGMSIMGLSYSLLASALWPMVALIIPEHQLGTAYGVMQSVQNLGLAVFSLVTGVIVDSDGYLILEVFFLDALCIALIAVIVLWLVDSTRNGILNMASAARKRRIKERELLRKKIHSPVSDSMPDAEKTSLCVSDSMTDANSADNQTSHAENPEIPVPIDMSSPNNTDGLVHDDVVGAESILSSTQQVTAFAENEVTSESRDMTAVDNTDVPLNDVEHGSSLLSTMTAVESIDSAVIDSLPVADNIDVSMEIATVEQTNNSAENDVSLIDVGTVENTDSSTINNIQNAEDGNNGVIQDATSIEHIDNTVSIKMPDAENNNTLSDSMDAVENSDILLTTDLTDTGTVDEPIVSSLPDTENVESNVLNTDGDVEDVNSSLISDITVADNANILNTLPEADNTDSSVPVNTPTVANDTTLSDDIHAIENNDVPLRADLTEAENTNDYLLGTDHPLSASLPTVTNDVDSALIAVIAAENSDSPTLDSVHVADNISDRVSDGLPEVDRINNSVSTDITAVDHADSPSSASITDVTNNADPTLIATNAAENNYSNTMDIVHIAENSNGHVAMDVSNKEHADGIVSTDMTDAENNKFLADDMADTENNGNPALDGMTDAE